MTERESIIKVGISGGPHTGKSTLFEALQVPYAGQYFIPEQARRIIAEERAKQEADPEYLPVVPWLNSECFNKAVLGSYVELEAGHNGEALSFQDRTIWDSKFYCETEGGEHLIPEIERLGRAANYAFILFCEPVGTYTADEDRVETEEQALRKHEGLREVYVKSGMNLVVLPSVSVEERMAIVADTLAKFE